MKIALIAHDRKKDNLIQFAIAYRDILAEHDLYATGTTGTMIEAETKLPITKFRSGPLGGDQQIGAMIANNDMDMVFFFRDPLNAKAHEPNEMTLLRLSDVHNIPVATNIATGEALIHALERGDLDWRDIVRV